MLMVIFGAGASFDSVKPFNRVRRDDDPYRPPLAKSLFELRENFMDIVAEYPECGPLIDRLRAAVRRGEPVEGALEAMTREAADYPTQHRAIAAIRFYLREVLWDCGSHWLDAGAKVTNYVILLDQILRWRAKRQSDESVLLVTFNYDTLLDDACASFGMTLSSPAEYITGSPFKLFKPHGSVNWFEEVDARAEGLRQYHGTAHYLIAQAPLKGTGTYFVRKGRTPHLMHRVPTRPHYQCSFPAIAIPVQRKNASTFACPSRHTLFLTDAIEGVDRLLIIGWRGTEDHFLEMWRPKRARLDRVVAVAESSSKATETLDLLRDADLFFNTTSTDPIGDGFTGLSESDNLSDLLGP